MKALKLTALFALATFAIVSCSKKDDAPAGPTYAGTATYEGKSYRTDSAYFLPDYDSTNQMDVGYFFISSNIASYFYTNGGTGNTIVLEYLQNTIVPGSYTFKNSGSVSLQNFVYGDALFDSNTDNEVYSKATAGTFTLAKADGTKYKIDYDLTLANGKKVTGTYTGVILQ